MRQEARKQEKPFRDTATTRSTTPARRRRRPGGAPRPAARGARTRSPGHAQSSAARRPAARSSRRRAGPGCRAGWPPAARPPAARPPGGGPEGWASGGWRRAPETFERGTAGGEACQALGKFHQSAVPSHPPNPPNLLHRILQTGGHPNRPPFPALQSLQLSPPGRSTRPARRPWPTRGPDSALSQIRCP